MHRKLKNCALSRVVQDVAKHSPVVMGCVMSELSMEQCIVTLANALTEANKNMVSLVQIAPRKITTEEGVKIWRCPDEFVPEAGAILPIHADMT